MNFKNMTSGADLGFCQGGGLALGEPGKSLLYAVRASQGGGVQKHLSQLKGMG